MTVQKIEERFSKPGRKPSPAAEQVPVTIDASSTALSVSVLDARAERVRAVALQVGYQLPGGGVDADLIQRDIAANMRRSVEACLEVGRGLTALKAACEHGEFGMRLGVLGIEDRVSRRFMLAAAKFSNRALAPDLTKAIGTQSKLFELLVLEDDEVEELAAGGEVRGLDADDIAGMTRNELRAALKDARETIDAKDRVLASNSERITSLEEKTARAFKPRPGSEARTADEELLLDEIQEATAGCQFNLRRLFKAADAAIIGSERDAIQLQARQAVEYLCQQLVDIAAEFNIAVDLEERLQPSWMSPEALTAMEKRQAERDAEAQ